MLYGCRVSCLRIEMKSVVKGYVYGTLSAVSYGTNPLFALPLYAVGLTAASVLVYRYLAGAILMGLMMLYGHRSLRLTGRELPLTVVAGCLIALSSIFLFEAYRVMDVGLASTLLFVQPVLLAIILRVFFKERITARTMVSIAVCVAGVAFLCNPGKGANVSAEGIVLVLLSALSYAVYLLLVNRSRLARMDSARLTFYALAFGQIVLCAYSGCYTRLQAIPADWLMVGCVIGIALFPTILSFSTVNLALRYVGPIPVAILGALEPITGLMIGVGMFGEVLTFRAVVGVVLILLAVMVLVTRR